MYRLCSFSVIMVLLIAVQVVQAEDNEPEFVLDDSLNVIAVAYPESDELISLATAQKVTIKRWDLNNGTLLSKTDLQSDRHGNLFLMTRPALSPDGLMIASSDDEGFCIWSAKTGKKVAILKNAEGVDVTHPAFSMDGKRLVASENAGLGIRLGASVNVFLWEIDELHDSLAMIDAEDAEAEKMILESARTFSHPGALQVHHVAISSDENVVASASQENGIALFEAKTGELRLIIENDNAKKKHPEIDDTASSAARQVLSVAFSPDGKLLASTDMFGVKIWSVGSGKLVGEMDKPFRYGHSRVTFSGNGKLVMRYDTDKLVTVWDVKTRKELLTLNTPALHAAFSPDCKQIAAGFSDRKSALKIFDIDFEEQKKIDSHF